jgi:hypothetical protein
MIRLRLLLTLFIILFLSPVVSADTVAPVTGESFDSLLAGQQVEWQRRLEAVYPESEGYSVTGPLDPLIKEPPGEWPVFSSLRVERL